jgi:predicted AlkP superfamily phosphohydrolase/phosphomutase
MKKVIVIGLDGLEPRIAESMQQSGQLPNLSRLAQMGGYSRVATTYPAQTPVAWSTFSTGVNPGGHGIFDFLSRDPKTYLPQLALNQYEQKNAFTPPKVINNRRGATIWSLLSASGIPSTVIRCPCTYPPDNIKGRMLSGVGVPDLRGGLGTSFYYTSAPGVSQENSEKVIQVHPQDGRITTFLIGPRDPKTRADTNLAITLELDPATKRVVLRSEGTPNVLELRQGEWSDWLKVKFKAGMFQSVRGMTRFYLRQVEPDFQLYAEPINFDPDAPLFPISHPTEYAVELQARLGGYYTIGMAEAHDGLINGRFDETAYLEQCNLVMRDRRRMMLSELDRFSEGFFFCLFDTPDRLQHMFWRFQEPEHPANCNGYSAEHVNVIAEHYKELDGIVGKAMKYMDDQTLFIVLSDHGMSSFQRGLNLNTWLYKNGFLELRSGLKPGDDEHDDFFRNVDWSRTKAYALGLGGIYLNLKGRESNGIVDLSEIGSTQNALVKGLTGLVDLEREKIAISSVKHRDEIYSGPYVNEAPDLLVNFTSGYRVSWGTPLGGVPAGLFEDNNKRWGGDHVIDPALVPGVLYINRSFRDGNPNMVDLAPTILAALGLPKIPVMEGEDLLT